MGSCCSIFSQVLETGMDYEFLFYRDRKYYSFEYTKVDIVRNRFYVYIVFVKYYLDGTCEIQIKGRCNCIDKLLKEVYYIMNHEDVMVKYKEIKNTMLIEIEKRINNK